MGEFVKYPKHQPIAGEEALLAEVLRNHGGLFVNRFEEWFKPYPKSLVYGFLDITVAMPTTVTLPGGEKKTFRTPMFFNGIVVKSLEDGRPYLGFKQEKGKDQQYHDVVGPLSGPLRSALTTIIFERADVQQAIRNGVAKLEFGAIVAEQPPAEIAIDGTDIPAEVPAEIEIPADAATVSSDPFAAAQDAQGMEAGS